MELGIYTFAGMSPDPATGVAISAHQRMQNLIEEVVLADQVGLDVFGIGEHHRPDFVISTPAIALAAGAARTKNIRLTSAVTVLSSDDPVRVFQEYATLDLISSGRAEIMAGRGSFIESFPLFGYHLNDYDDLFAEKLDLLLKLRASERVTWSGKFRAPIDNLAIYPRPLQDPLPVWIAVGGTPASVVRAGTLGLPLAVAIIGGEPHRFKPLVDLYRQSGAKAGHAPEKLKVSINSHGYVAESSQAASDEYWPSYEVVMNKIGRERGWPPSNRAQYEAGRTMRGALLVGSPQEIIDKIMLQHSYFQHDRFMLQIDLGSLPHLNTLRAIELYGTKVAPAIRKELGGNAQAGNPGRSSAASRIDAI
ncbi:LLM class flavin-dependent oxidoreductase [Phyllobacterium endophyticum]|uniref:LLM class flavin-dependent oxidoreductase n=1 Tax=Phyllobacterium endophyticum TaxID=1149773 RepID=A0A2P7AUA3_9HYPH|nr:LLM class flavin-dependent oxidoreductase [Phyllobacterium endophyticum]MBB3234226.1 putative LLM family oxidoreductase [Phyllobacterium endophyticum]PSH57777.1 LLM class flavin-dependent oxidoreductase [Phyllobacterium endophyticum]TYR43976.1 LLM class flavin-dependent oxidoreductase [Phyllobacterium endophyticum]